MQFFIEQLWLFPSREVPGLREFFPFKSRQHRRPPEQTLAVLPEAG